MHSDEIQRPILAGQRLLYATLDRVWNQQTSLIDHESAADFYDAHLR